MNTPPCAVCGKPVPPAGNPGATARRRSCSPECKAILKRRRRENLAGPGYQPRERYVGPCKECGAEIPEERRTKKHAARTVTCSPECGRKRHRRRNLRRSREVRDAAKAGVDHRQVKRRRIAERTYRRLVRVEGML